MVFVDANARVGSVKSEGIGIEQPDKETCSGEMFRLFLKRTGTAAINTFFPAGHTWTSTRMTTSRIDYIVLPLQSLSAVKDCYAGGDIDLTMDDTVDHLEVVADIFAKQNLLRLLKSNRQKASTS